VGSFLKIYKSIPNFKATLCHGESYALISPKMGWAKFWAIFSQSRLVTL
jgi:hypothetical protein